MSAIIVSLDKFPSVDPAKVQKDSELNDMIVDEIKGNFYNFLKMFLYIFV